MLEYTRRIGGILHTFQAREEDAERLGIDAKQTAPERDKARRPQDKQRNPRNKTKGGERHG